MTAEDAVPRLLKRWARLAACPACQGELSVTPGSPPAMQCSRCGAGVTVSSGFIVALSGGDPHDALSRGRSGRRTGWASAIAADLNQKSETYSEKYGRYTLKTRGFILRRDLALELVGSTPGRVLEAGCGPGVVAPQLSGLGEDVHGVDLSAEQLRLAAARDSTSLYVQADLEHLPYQDGVFDTVIMLGVFEYLERPQAVLRELRRATQDGSRLIISLPNGGSPARLWTEYVYIPLVRACKRIVGKPLPAYSRTLYSAGKCARLLADVGLRLERLIFFDVAPIPAPFNRLLPASTIHLVDMLERRLGGLLRRLVASQFFIVAVADGK